MYICVCVCVRGSRRSQFEFDWVMAYEKNGENESYRTKFRNFVSQKQL
jgi:hypothetical protein